jgi:hypothetical protein
MTVGTVVSAGQSGAVGTTRICYTTFRAAIFWVITQRVVVISYRRFGTTYRSHLQGSGIQKDVTLDKTFYSLFKIPMGKRKKFFVDNLVMRPQKVSSGLH